MPVYYNDLDAMREFIEGRIDEKGGIKEGRKEEGRKKEESKQDRKKKERKGYKEGMKVKKD